MDQKIGAEGDLKITVSGGKASISLIYEGKQADASVVLSTDVDRLIDALEALAIAQGPFAKGGLELLRVALKTVSV